MLKGKKFDAFTLLRDIVLILEVISGLILLDQVLDLVPEAQYPKAIQ